MVKRISLVCTLTQTRMGEDKVTFPSMGLRKGQYDFLVTNPEVFIYIRSFIISGGFSSDFIKMCMHSSLECPCTLFKTRMCAWYLMLPDMGSLRDQYVFIMVKFLYIRFSIFS